MPDVASDDDTRRDDERVDGRTARARRTRDAVVDALLELIEEGNPRPTAPKIAERAGVSLRSVFQHFSDLDSLFVAAAGRHMGRLRKLYKPLQSSGSAGERIRAMVEQRARIWEASTPVRRAALRAAPFSEALRNVIAVGNRLTRAEVENVFGPELALRSGQGQRDLVDALDCVLSWHVWERLRAEQGLSVRRTSHLTETLVAQLLGTLPPGPP